VGAEHALDTVEGTVHDRDVSRGDAVRLEAFDRQPAQGRILAVRAVAHHRLAHCFRQCAGEVGEQRGVGIASGQVDDAGGNRRRRLWREGRTGQEARAAAAVPAGDAAPPELAVGSRSRRRADAVGGGDIAHRGQGVTRPHPAPGEIALDRGRYFAGRGAGGKISYWHVIRIVLSRMRQSE
jgi:hypothetical protein